MFCTADKTMMRPVNGVLTCPKCGATKSADSGMVVKAKAVDDVKKTVIDHGDSKMDLLPTTEEYVCEKCGNAKAFYYMRQTRAADEATTRFLECTECKHKWREYR